MWSKKSNLTTRFWDKGDEKSLGPPYYLPQFLMYGAQIFPVVRYYKQPYRYQIFWSYPYWGRPGSPSNFQNFLDSAEIFSKILGKSSFWVISNFEVKFRIWRPVFEIRGTKKFWDPPTISPNFWCTAPKFFLSLDTIESPIGINFFRSYPY